jgi:hypothetical protein
VLYRIDESRLATLGGVGQPGAADAASRFPFGACLQDLRLRMMQNRAERAVVHVLSPVRARTRWPLLADLPHMPMRALRARIFMRRALCH